MAVAPFEPAEPLELDDELPGALVAEAAGVALAAGAGVALATGVGAGVGVATGVGAGVAVPVVRWVRTWVATSVSLASGFLARISRAVAAREAAGTPSSVARPWSL
ncbi:hypothetical protein D3C72_1201170 [compost metagenome]